MDLDPGRVGVTRRRLQPTRDARSRQDGSQPTAANSTTAAMAVRTNTAAGARHATARCVAGDPAADPAKLLRQQVELTQTQPPPIQQETASTQHTIAGVCQHAHGAWGHHPAGPPVTPAVTPQSVLQGLMSQSLKATHKQQHKCMQATGDQQPAPTCVNHHQHWGQAPLDWQQQVGGSTTPSLVAKVSGLAFMHGSAAGGKAAQYCCCCCW